jgi:hypothetical protein
MKRGWYCLPLCLMLTAVGRAAPEIVSPFERATWPITTNQIDVHVLAVLQQRGIEPAAPCADAVFFRRVHVDVLGTLPEPAATRAFLQNTRTDKRAALIETLFTRDEFADYWALKWCDLLRVKAEFPINLWPNAVQAYHRWIHAAVRTNMPYDVFARTLLTASGSNFREPPVNFYRAVQSREPVAIADAVALTFMGARSASWPAGRREGMAGFFARIAFKPTGEWKEEIVCLNPAPSNTPPTILPDGTPVTVPPGADPRIVFADWLVRPDNPWFARAVVNRIWAWLLGRGIVHEPDDIRPDNPPANPQLLACLERELAAAQYDLRHIFRLILNSRTYQQSSIPRSTNALAEALCAYYPVRRLDAEVLIDALCWIGGEGERYASAIPEPYTFIPERMRTIALADGSITSPFLELFGRPARDTGLETERNNQPTAAQRLYLLNATDVQRRIERGRLLRDALPRNPRQRSDVLPTLYLALLTRYPTDTERAAAAEYLRTQRGGGQQAVADITWALINSKEFLYRH